MLALFRLWRNLFRKERLDCDLNEEIRSYVQMLADEKVAAGMEASKARREAAMESGGIEQVKEQVREIRTGRLLESFLQDVRHALRGLQRNVGSTILATLMLALGIGATTLIFSIYYAVLLQPLPFSNPERLVQLWETRPQKGWQQASFMDANFWNLQKQNRAFQDVGAFAPDEMNLTGLGSPEHLSIGRVSAKFFHILGVAPIIGRGFLSEEDQPGHNHQVALLENKFWRARFGGSSAILGQTLRLDNRPYTVIGVLPAGEPWLNGADVFIPMPYNPSVTNDNGFELNVIGRLAPGVSIQGARSDLKRVCRELAAQDPDRNAGMGVKIEPASDWGAGMSVHRALWVLLGAVGFLLLIACVNLANLLLAKGAARSREFTLRAALGASRGRIVRLVLTEALLLCSFGACWGLLLTSLGLGVIRAANPSGIPRISEIGINGWILGFTLTTTVLAGMLSGLLPALQALRVNVAATLREGDRSQMGSRSQNRLRSMLITAEVALSFILLIGAGLLIRSFDKLLHVDRGFHSASRVVFSVNLPGSYPRERVEDTLGRFLSRISSLPGVLSAAAVNTRPIIGLDVGMGIVAADHPGSANDNVPWASWRAITGDYFRAMGIPLLKGKALSERDEKGSVPRVVISQKLAELLWPGEDPIGRKAVLWKGHGNDVAEVIGVVGNIRDHGLDSDPTRIVYIPYYRISSPAAQFIVQTATPSQTIVPLLRSSLAAINPSLPLSDVQMLDSVVTKSLGPKRMNTALLAVFAGIALVLAIAGIYGVLAYSVAKRTGEIGIRVALGADPKKIFALIIGQGMRPVALGIAIGLAGSVALSRVLLGLLFEVKPIDITTYCSVVTFLITTALVACYFPARRALQVDPASALREE